MSRLAGYSKITGQLSILSTLFVGKVFSKRKITIFAL